MVRIDWKNGKGIPNAAARTAGRFAEARMKHKIISIPPVYFLTCIIITLLLHVLVSSLN
jgi:hypothetical protein